MSDNVAYPPQQNYQYQNQGYSAPAPGGYDQNYNNAAGHQAAFVPEWRRIMTSDSELFSFSLPCVAAFFFPNVVQGLAACQIGTPCDFLCIFCCYPFVCGSYRSKIKSALGVNMMNDSCLMNCCLHYWCHCFAAAQEYRAVTTFIESGASAMGAVPQAPAMY